MSPSAGEPEAGMVCQDRERFADADHVLHGPDGSGLVGRVLYAVYVTGFLAVIYAYSILRAVLLTSDRTWLRTHLGGWSGAAVGVVALIVVLGVGWTVGRRRGPATPPLPWVDQVVATSLDRAVALRPWWRAALIGITGCTAILGAVLGTAVHAAGASLIALPVGFLCGGIVAAASVWVSLAAQSQASRWAHEARSARSLAESRLLRSLGIEELRTQARRGQRLLGAALAGDPRAARLDVASTVRRGRALRLRPGGFIATIARRDLIGLRRQPVLALAGALAAVAGFGLTTMTLLDATTPVPVTALGIGLVHLATGQWSQGLRSAADGVSSPTLFGGSPVRRAVGHSLVPAVALVLVGTCVGGLGCLIGGAGATVLGEALLVPLTMLPLTIGAHWWSAFRVSHPDRAFIPEMGPILLVVGVARPWIVVVASGTATLQRLHGLPSPWLGLALLGVTGSFVLWRGRSLARQLVDEGR